MTPADQLTQIIQGRRSIRHYDDTPIPADILEAVIDAARWAPSPHHALPFRFALITGAEPKGRLAAAMGASWESDLTRDGVPATVIAREIAKSHDRLVHGGAIVIGCIYVEPLDEYPDAERQSAEHTMAAHALGAAMQNVMLSAHAHGLGSSWMCAPLFCPETVRSALELPDAWIPHGLLTVGYPAQGEQSALGSRPPIDSILIRRP